MLRSSPFTLPSIFESHLKIPLPIWIKLKIMNINRIWLWLDAGFIKVPLLLSVFSQSPDLLAIILDLTKVASKFVNFKIWNSYEVRGLFSMSMWFDCNCNCEWMHGAKAHRNIVNINLPDSIYYYYSLNLNRPSI